MPPQKASPSLLDLAPTCDLQAFIVGKPFSEKPSHDQFGALQEANLFLYQSLPEHSSTYQICGKIHLYRVRQRDCGAVSLVTIVTAQIQTNLVLYYNINDD